MAWTAPRTWVAGEVVTAGMLNTHVRDNLLALGDPTIAAYGPPAVIGVATSSDFGRVSYLNRRARVEFKFTMSGVPTGALQISLPVTATTPLGIGPAATIGAVTGIRAGVGYFNGNVYLVNSTTAGFVGSTGNNLWQPGAPATWAPGDSAGGYLEYEF